MNPDLDDMDAPPRAANPAVKRAESADRMLPGAAFGSALLHAVT
jgi:hypothetical protein